MLFRENGCLCIKKKKALGTAHAFCILDGDCGYDSLKWFIALPFVYLFTFPSMASSFYSSAC